MGSPDRVDGAMGVDRPRGLPRASSLDLGVLPDGDSHGSASCAGMASEVFYPPDHLNGLGWRRHVDRAKQICRCCPLLCVCRNYAIAAQEPFGVWGATTPRERRELLADNS